MDTTIDYSSGDEVMDNYYGYSYDYDYSNGSVGQFECERDTLYHYNIFILTIIVIGFLGNTSVAVILHRCFKPTVMVLLLKILLFMDNLYLVSYITFMYLTYYYMYTASDLQWGYIMYAIFAESFLFICQTCSIWTTVIIGFYRYIAITRPFSVQRICTTKNTVIIVILSIITNVIIHIPGFMAYKVISSDNQQPDQPQWDLEETSWARSKAYAFGYRIVFMSIIMRGVLPFIGLGFCYIFIIHTLCVQLKLRKTTSQGIDKQPDTEANCVTSFVIAILTLVIICYLPSTINAIVQEISPELYQVPCGTSTFFLNFVVDALMVFNSCANFIVYFLLRRRFRDTCLTCKRRSDL